MMWWYGSSDCRAVHDMKSILTSYMYNDGIADRQSDSSFCFCFQQNTHLKDPAGIKQAPRNWQTLQRPLMKPSQLFWQCAHIAKTGDAGIAEESGKTTTITNQGLLLSPRAIWIISCWIKVTAVDASSILATAPCCGTSLLLTSSTKPSANGNVSTTTQPLHTRLTASGAAFLSPFLLLENKPFLAVQISTLFKNLIAWANLSIIAESYNSNYLVV